jgi:hypothetical protein
VVEAKMSPDGQRIAMIVFRTRKGRPDVATPSLWVMSANGGKARRLRVGVLEDDTYEPDSLSWQPVAP